MDESGTFLGKITMIDIFRALEPNYKRSMVDRSSGTLTADFVTKAVKEFKPWLEPEKDICQRGSKKTVAEVMHTPNSVEYIQQDDTAEKAKEAEEAAVHQPLIVKDGGTITGVLRFGDVFEVVRKSLLGCDIDA